MVFLDNNQEDNHEHRHHEHDEDCHCHDHEHDHEHHHEHDEDCHCHEHEHEHHHHEHDEDCHCHDHEHEHHHHEHDEDCHCDECVSGVSIVDHQGALAASFDIDVDMDKATADNIIRESMTLIRDIVKKKKGVIGHIKAAIVEDELTAMYSLTAKDISVVGDYEKIENVERVSFVAIVYGLDELVLRSLLVVARERLA